LLNNSNNKISIAPNHYENEKKADWYHNKGFEARKNNNFELAIEYYSEALLIKEDHFKALFNRGFAYDKIK